MFGSDLFGADKDYKKMEKQNDVNGLIRLLDDDVYAGSGAEALGNLREESAIRPLERLIEAPARTWEGDINDTAISSALEALGKISGDFASSTCTFALNNYWQTTGQGNATIYAGALRGLGEYGDPEDIHKIVPFLNEDRFDNFHNGHVKFYAALALSNISAIGLTESLINSLENANYSGGSISDESSITIIIQALGKLRDPTAVPTIISLLNHNNAKIRDAAVSDIGNYGDKSAVEPLVQVMKEVDDDYGTKSLLGSEALFQLADYRHKDLILEMLESNSKMKSVLASNILLNWDNEEFSAHLEYAGFKMESAKLRKDIGYLVGKMESNNEEIRTNALKLLIEFNPKTLGKFYNNVLDELVNYIQQRDASDISIFIDALRYLLRHEREKCSDEILTQLTKTKRFLKREGLFLDYRGDDQIMIDMLADVEDKRVFEFITPSLLSDYDWDREKASENLAKLGGTECTKILENQSQAFNVHVLWSQRNIDGLLNILDKKSNLTPPKRWEQKIALKALGHLKKPETIEKVIEFFHNPNGEIRIAASNALSKFSKDIIKEQISLILNQRNKVATITALSFLRENRKKVRDLDNHFLPLLINVLRQGSAIEKMQASALLSQMSNLDSKMELLVEMKIKDNGVAEDLLNCLPPEEVGIHLEKKELFDEANNWYQSHGLLDEAANVRRKKADLHPSKTVIHGNYIDDRDTIVKDSVVNRSNIGSEGKSKAEELREIKALLDEGIIDDDEFMQMKKEIISK